MRSLALFGIENNALSLVAGLLVLFLIALWLALVFYTYTDARRRIADPMLVGTAVVAALVFPFVGTVVYMIVRPPEYLEDVRERELEIQAAEARLSQLEGDVCPYCDFEVDKDFLRCPSCLRRLKEPCRTCAKPLDPRWKICPYCEAEVSSGQSRGRARAGGRPAAPRSRAGGAAGRSGGAPAASEGAPAGGAVSPPAG
jgi:Double zinc ribbon